MKQRQQPRYQQTAATQPNKRLAILNVKRAFYASLSPFVFQSQTSANVCWTNQKVGTVCEGDFRRLVGTTNHRRELEAEKKTTIKCREPQLNLAKLERAEPSCK